jgi:hypothetical protein
MAADGPPGACVVPGGADAGLDPGEGLLSFLLGLLELELGEVLGVLLGRKSTGGERGVLPVARCRDAFGELREVDRLAAVLVMGSQRAEVPG